MLSALFLLIKSIVLFICLALGVGFYTLLERKVLSYIQMRKGPNKVGFIGLPQPLADAAKLFTKETPKINLVNKGLYILRPVAAVCIMLVLWLLYMSSYGFVAFKLGALFFFAVSSLNVYRVLLSGWSSNSKYALLGAIRAVAQTISYEVRIALVFIALLLIMFTFDLSDLGNSGVFIWSAFTLPVIFVLWLITCLAETNRAPFDLAEGESELVSGFNIEYGGGEFAFLFIAEYGRILFMSALTACLFIGGYFRGIGLLNLVKVLFIAFVFLWVRGTYPRMRYDVLMSLTWKSFLCIRLRGGILLLPLA